MIIQYTHWHKDAKTAEDRVRHLLKVFMTVLLHVNADADKALEVIESWQKRYDVLKGMTMDEYMKFLEERGLIERDAEGKPRATKSAQRKLRSDALAHVFRDLKKADAGDHETPKAGSGTEKLTETRPYTYGDSTAGIDITETLRNAYLRAGDPEADSFRLIDDDIRVHETEHSTSCATVLLIDISHSMILYGEDRITPAKRVALALAELITTRFPKDSIDVVVFGDEARRVSIEDIPFIHVGPFHTNTLDGIRMARQLLRRSRSVNKQIFMVTDG
ncbi:MAG: VWA domain-containing protein, partial [Candidatus Kapaibacterium sp.]